MKKEPSVEKTAASESKVDHVLELTNESALVMGILLNQEGWTKTVEDLITAGDLLCNVFPTEKPVEDVEKWDGKPFKTTLTKKQFAVAKRCFDTLVLKGNLMPGTVSLALCTALDYNIPDTEEKFTLKLLNIGAKYILDILSTIPPAGKKPRIDNVEDLVTGSQVRVKLPTVPKEFAPEPGKAPTPANEKDLNAWMDQPFELKLTERQRTFCQTQLKRAAEEGGVKANKYIPALYTEFGLRE